MILMKGAVSSILVLLGACERATPSSNNPPPGTEPAAVAVASTTAESSAQPVVVASESASVAGAGATPPTVKPSPVRGRAVARTVYVCPMHPEVVADKPGLCPKCNMKLDPKPQVAEERPSPTADSGLNES